MAVGYANIVIGSLYSGKTLDSPIRFRYVGLGT
jgi:hypothetical protein